MNIGGHAKRSSFLRRMAWCMCLGIVQFSKIIMMHPETHHLQFLLPFSQLDPSKPLTTAIPVYYSMENLSRHEEKELSSTMDKGVFMKQGDAAGQQCHRIGTIHISMPIKSSNQATPSESNEKGALLEYSIQINPHQTRIRMQCTTQHCTRIPLPGMNDLSQTPCEIKKHGRRIIMQQTTCAGYNLYAQDPIHMPVAALVSSDSVVQAYIHREESVFTPSILTQTLTSLLGVATTPMSHPRVHTIGYALEPTQQNASRVNGLSCVIELKNGAWQNNQNQIQWSLVLAVALDMLKRLSDTHEIPKQE